MKYGLMILFAVAVVVNSGCTKCAGVFKKTVTPEEIGSTMAPVICEKYASCNQGTEFNKEQCLKDIGDGITENLKTAQNLKIDKAMLDACQKSILASTCEVLNSAAPPAGCEFLQ